MTEFINLTPHPVTVQDGAGGEITISPSGAVARVATIETEAPPVGGIPTIFREFGEVENLPPPEAGVVFIVSSLVLGAIRGRDDVVAPDTGSSAVRDDAGRIVAVTRLVRAS